MVCPEDGSSDCDQGLLFAVVSGDARTALAEECLGPRRADRRFPQARERLELSSVPGLLLDARSFLKAAASEDKSLSVDAHRLRLEESTRSRPGVGSLTLPSIDHLAA